MGVSRLFLVIAIQFAVLLAPIVMGLAGWLSGGTAGLVSIVAWAGGGIPVSYSAIDRPRTPPRTREVRPGPVAALPGARA